MYNRLSTFLNKHSIIFSEQFGFRKCYSTESALLFASELLYKFYEKKEIALGVYVDFSKAFDCLDHQILLKLVYSFGRYKKYIVHYFDSLPDNMKYCTLKLL